VDRAAETHPAGREDAEGATPGVSPARDALCPFAPAGVCSPRR